ncbi:MAG: peptidyl-prolyl cis-trans isomerase cyclophilin type [Bacteroidota bacterium]|jgi:peptidylprolyl isomerase|nr:peptidyl-prolyl cis-trans isomerase cyclophilin type [Bacteroidota bacterium]
MKPGLKFSLFTLLLLSIISLTALSPFKDDGTGSIRIMVVTDFGTMKIRLYNETPLHRDNFAKLVKEHYFDSLLFHRVIEKFMIQGGDPDSRKAPSGVLLGDGGPPYTVPAEFNSKLFHKKGVIAAARDSDFENPSQASSGSQFYIVQGKVWTDSLLKVQAKRITKMKLFNTVINRPENKEYLEKYKKYNKAEKVDSVKYIYDIIDKKVEAELPGVPLYTFSPEQIAAYTTIGGTPHLDNSYTIFGEVYEGLEVIDKIAAVKTDKNNRPVDDVRIRSISIIP